MAELKPTNEELIRQFQGGDDSAYEELVERFKGPLYSFIYRILGDAAFAEDLLQETFYRLWTNKHSYREIARFSTWIYTVAGNLAKTELRKHKIRRWIPFSGGKDGQYAIEPVDHSKNPDKDLERSTIKRRVEEEIQLLPKAFKDVIILRDVQCLSYEEVSEVLKIPLGTVKSRVNRGRQRLQRKLTDLR